MGQANIRSSSSQSIVEESFIPVEVGAEIMRHLHLVDITSLACTCHHLRTTAQYALSTAEELHIVLDYSTTGFALEDWFLNLCYHRRHLTRKVALHVEHMALATGVLRRLAPRQEFRSITMKHCDLGLGVQVYFLCPKLRLDHCSGELAFSKDIEELESFYTRITWVPAPSRSLTLAGTRMWEHFESVHNPPSELTLACMPFPVEMWTRARNFVKSLTIICCTRVPDWVVSEIIEKTKTDASFKCRMMPCADDSLHCSALQRSCEKVWAFRDALRLELSLERLCAIEVPDMDMWRLLCANNPIAVYLENGGRDVSVISKMMEMGLDVGGMASPESYAVGDVELEEFFFRNAGRRYRMLALGTLQCTTVERLHDRMRLKGQNRKARVDNAVNWFKNELENGLFGLFPDFIRFVMSRLLRLSHLKSGRNSLYWRVLRLCFEAAADREVRMLGHEGVRLLALCFYADGLKRALALVRRSRLEWTDVCQLVRRLFEVRRFAPREVDEAHDVVCMLVAHNCAIECPEQWKSETLLGLLVEQGDTALIERLLRFPNVARKLNAEVRSTLQFSVLGVAVRHSRRTELLRLLWASTQEAVRHHDDAFFQLLLYAGRSADEDMIVAVNNLFEGTELTPEERGKLRVRCPVVGRVLLW